MSEHPVEDDGPAFVVFLHGLAGQSRNGDARELIGTLPGVRKVTESLVTPTILVVWLHPPDSIAPPCGRPRVSNSP